MVLGGVLALVIEDGGWSAERLGTAQSMTDNTIAGTQSRARVTRDSDTEMLGSAGRMASADRHTANPIRRAGGMFGEKWAGEDAGSFTLRIFLVNQNILTQKLRE